MALNDKYYFQIGRGNTYEDSESNVMQFTMEENSLTSCDSQYLSTKSVILKKYIDVYKRQGYARQDRKAKARDPISAKLVADLITTAGADRVLTMDLHAAQIQGFFNIPVDHLLGVPILAPYFEERFKDQNDVVVVSPDLGSVTRARKFAERMNAPLAIIDKRRPKANVSEVMNIIGDVKGKRAVIVDDLVDTAGTLCNGAKAIIEVGGATEVYACATHGVLSLSLIHIFCSLL